MANDYTNWAVERQKLKDEIMTELREQKDRQLTVVREGKFTFNPNNDSTVEYGPVLFNLRFSRTPTLAFGQELQDSRLFYVCEPVITRWHLLNGVIDGFYFKVYSLTDIPDNLQKHILSWVVKGESSRYSDHVVKTAWRAQYRQDVPSYLIQTNFEARGS